MENELIKTLQSDFEQFEDCYLLDRNNWNSPDFLMSNRLWRLFDTVAKHVEQYQTAKVN